MTPEFLEDVAVRTRRLRRNRENGLFYGVCAGISEGFRWPVNTVRLVAVLSLIVAGVGELLPPAVDVASG